MARHRSKPQETTEFKECSWEGCGSHAEFMAPKYKRVQDTPLRESDCRWFCLEHIRQHNKSWNFFDGMSDEEAMEFQMDAVLGHRDTRPREHMASSLRAQRLKDASERFMHTLFPDETLANIPTLPQQEREALATLELSFPIKQEHVKQRYKTLVKRYHPDVNKGSKQCEARFKEITAAYRILSQSELIG